jgi:DNA ligase-1
MKSRKQLKSEDKVQEKGKSKSPAPAKAPKKEKAAPVKAQPKKAAASRSQSKGKKAAPAKTTGGKKSKKDMDEDEDDFNPQDEDDDYDEDEEMDELADEDEEDGMDDDEDFDDDDDDVEVGVKPSSRLKLSRANGSNKRGFRVSGSAMDEDPICKEVEVEIDSNLEKYLETTQYDPIKHAPFKKDTPVPFRFICDSFDLMGNIRGQNSIERKKILVTNMFKTLQILRPQEVADLFLFLTGRMDAEYKQDDIGVGKEILLRSIAAATGCSKEKIETDNHKVGDLGDVLERRLSMFREKAKGKTTKTTISAEKSGETGLTFEYVFTQIRALTKTPGLRDKESLLAKLFTEADGREGKYIIRYIQGGNFKIGSSTSYTTASLARCFHELSSKEMQKAHSLADWEKAVKRVSHHFPDYKHMVIQMQECKGDPTKLSSECRITVGIPCKPMLAKPTKDIKVVFSRFDGNPFTCEYKYDGLRGQLHYKDNTLTIYSRNLENMTQTYPDIVEYIVKAIRPGVKEFIADSEIVALDRKTNLILPFQFLMKRKKKNVDIEKLENKVCLYVFDCLYVDGQSLLDLPLSKRREHLRNTLIEVPGHVQYVTSKEMEDSDEIMQFLDESVKAGCEGLMVKTLEANSTYEPSMRTFKWLKLKRDYLDKARISDSLDLVVVGAKKGEGKRTGVYGTLLLACWNEEKERYETTGMVGTGFNDDDLVNLYDKLSPLIVKRPPDQVFLKEGTGPRKMDVWFEPKVICEILATDIQISQAYTCGVGVAHPDRGLGLRFPRFLKLRKDKSGEDASPASLIVEMYNKQASVINKMIANGDMDDDPDD